VPDSSRKNPGVLLLRLLPPPFGEPGVDGEGGLLGQPQHLRVGLAGELAQDQRLGPGRVGVAQVPERLGDRPGLRERQRPAVEQGEDAGQPGLLLPGQPGGGLRRLDGAGQRGRQLVA
jgi:hypothetical protein